ncbi:MAG: hypothetical protein ACW97Z_17625 [Candidatus Hodarchaeales archaeon]
MNRPVSETIIPFRRTTSDVLLRSSTEYAYATSSPNSNIEALTGEVIVTAGATVSDT